MRFRLGLHILALATLLPSCYGHSVQRSPDPARAMVVNGGATRYVFALTPIRHLKPRTSPATPIVTVVPPGLSEAGIINVKLENCGWGFGGSRSTESEFYPELSRLAAELGGQNFAIANKSVFQGGPITAMTVSVLAP